MSGPVVLLTAVLAWAASIAFLFWRDHCHWQRIYLLLGQFDAERQRLLDRIMTRDWTQFKQMQVYEDVIKAQTRPPEETPADDLSEVGF